MQDQAGKTGTLAKRAGIDRPVERHRRKEAIELAGT